MTYSTPPICDYENSSYRTDFWEGRGREYEDAVERIALRRLLPPAGRRLIDIGAGFGRLADLYTAYEQVILLDYSHSQLVYARQHLGVERFIYIAADVYHLPLAASSVDTVVMVRVMHHLANVPLALGQLKRVVLPGGTCVLEFANKRHMKNLIRGLLGHEPSPFSQEPFEFAPLHYNFHPKWMREQLEASGFSINQTLSVSLFRSTLLKRLLGTNLLVKMDRIQQSFLAPLAIAPSIFVSCTTATSATATLAPANELFICPTCQSRLLDKLPEGLYCERCQRLWPLVDGVYMFK